MTILGKKSLGVDPKTTLEKELHIWQITIDGKSEVILVVYDIVLLAPTGAVIKTLETNNFVRFNKKAVLDSNGVEISPANMKFDALKLSPIGQGILALLQVDLAAIQGIDTLFEDLRQK